MTHCSFEYPDKASEIEKCGAVLCIKPRVNQGIALRGGHWGMAGGGEGKSLVGVVDNISIIPSKDFRLSKKMKKKNLNPHIKTDVGGNAF